MKERVGIHFKIKIQILPYAIDCVYERYLPDLFSGGQGGRGGRGIKCKFYESCGFIGSCSSGCRSNGQTGEAARGPTGAKGSDGQS